jgi:hypothetical protein
MSDDEAIDAVDHYAELPITVTAKETTVDRTYEGKLNMYTDSAHPLTIKVPAPAPGLYRYTVTLTRETNDHCP